MADLRHIFGDFSGWEEREMLATRNPPGVTLLELGLCQCRWPVAEDTLNPGRHYFCGLAIRPGDTYCDEHWRKARGR